MRSLSIPVFIPFATSLRNVWLSAGASLRPLSSQALGHALTLCCPRCAFSLPQALAFGLQALLQARRKLPAQACDIVLRIDLRGTKSLLAASVLQRVGAVVGAPGWVEVAVEGDEELDLSGFKLRAHAGVLLDGVGDACTLLRRREVLQGRPKKCYGGRSATMMYAYPYTLARRAVVATMDLTAKNLHLVRSNHWLKDPRNVALVWLTGPAWVTPAGSAAAEGPTPETWSVAEVAAFFEGHDAGGVADIIRRNAVSGADLLAFEAAPEVARELNISASVARKMLALRDSHMR